MNHLAIEKAPQVVRPRYTVSKSGRFIRALPATSVSVCSQLKLSGAGAGWRAHGPRFFFFFPRFGALCRVFVFAAWTSNQKGELLEGLKKMNVRLSERILFWKIAPRSFRLVCAVVVKLPGIANFCSSVSRRSPSSPPLNSIRVRIGQQHRLVVTVAKWQYNPNLSKKIKKKNRCPEACVVLKNVIFFKRLNHSENIEFVG